LVQSPGKITIHHAFARLNHHQILPIFVALNPQWSSHLTRFGFQVTLRDVIGVQRDHQQVLGKIAGKMLNSMIL
jgi:hypothetical protein